MTYLELSDKSLRRSWDTFEAFMAEVQTPKPLVPDAYEQGSMDTRRERWFGTPSFDAAVQLAANGWPQGLARIKQLSTTLKPLAGEQADRHIAKFCESGDEVDIGRFVTGEPECMMDYELVQVPAAGRVVKIVLQMSASADIDQEQYFMRGAAAVMLADLVEQSGLRSEIVLACGISRHGKEDAASAYTMTIKRPNQPLELDRVAFLLAHPSTFRRLMFHIFEQLPQPEFQLRHGSTYGTPANVKVEGSVIEVDALQYGFGNKVTKENCAALVQAMINRYMEPD